MGRSMWDGSSSTSSPTRARLLSSGPSRGATWKPRGQDSASPRTIQNRHVIGGNGGDESATNLADASVAGEESELREAPPPSVAGIGASLARRRRRPPPAACIGLFTVMARSRLRSSSVAYKGCR
ncbi:hypothetical protein NL676_029106 [Syzygium grande]|nr:hypothetical protein NL676_029106 [Syzygium grande]